MAERQFGLSLTDRPAVGLRHFGDRRLHVMPGVASTRGVENLLDPRENIMAGARLLRELLDQHRGNLKMALASYNAGAKAVARYRRVPPFPETQAYVRKVTQLFNSNKSRAGD